MFEISFDLDGVLNNYPYSFLEFIKKEHGEDFQSIVLARSKLGDALYEDIKHRFRISSDKYSQPYNRITKDLMSELHSSGYVVSIHSSRPFSIYSNMLPRTNDWLVRNSFCVSEVGIKDMTDLLSKGIKLHIDDDFAEILRLDKIAPGKLCYFLYDGQLGFRVIKGESLSLSDLTKTQEDFLKAHEFDFIEVSMHELLQAKLQHNEIE